MHDVRWHILNSHTLFYWNELMRSYNFYPGPSALPEEVLVAFRDEILEYRDTGASFIELSHRSHEVLECHDRIVAQIRAMLGVDEDYHVLLLPGGAIGQYAAIPLNLLAETDTVAMCVTGHWSKIASQEMAKYCNVHVCVDTGPRCNTIPAVSSWDVPANSRCLAFVDNETIHGVEFQSLPRVNGLPLIVDQSSNIFSRPIVMDEVGVLFACLQKNLGPSGLAVVVVRADLCESPRASTPRIWDYPLQAANQSMANTPPTFQFRLLELMLAWIADQGGVEVLNEGNQRKAVMLYEYIDSSDFYRNEVDPAYRSRMNVPFQLANEGLDGDFVTQAKAAGLIGIKGHRAVGGMRASIYNAMPLAGIEALVSFMKDFAQHNG